jgi:hypothetical protein
VAVGGAGNVILTAITAIEGKKMHQIVFVKASVAVGWNGGVVHLRQGDAWDASDRFVEHHRSLFSDDAAVYLHRTEPVVEQATAAPGEKRSVTRG